MTEFTSQQIDAILPFLERFEANGFSPGIWDSPPGAFPNFYLNDVVLDFLNALSENGWIDRDFYWPAWQKEAVAFVDSPEKLATADTTIIQKLFTTHARKDRFCEGHWAAMFECGHVVAVLRRLKELRTTLEQQ